MKVKQARWWLVRFALASICALAVVLFLVSWGKKTHAQAHIPVHMTTDWSNRHMIYSAPSSMAQAWRLQAEPRYLHQLTRRNAPAMQQRATTTDVVSENAAGDVEDREGGDSINAPSKPNEDDGSGDDDEHEHRHKPTSVRNHGDWGMSLLANGLIGIGQFPAKFSFDVSASPDCANDYVVFPNGLLEGQATAAATRNGTFSALTTSGIVTVRSSEGSLRLTASTTTNTGTNFQVGGSTASQATNLALAINRNSFAALGSGHIKVMASSAAGVVTVTASKDGVTAMNGVEGNSTILGRAVVPGGSFTWAGGTLAGGIGRGSIVAFNNLYSTQGAAGGLCNQNGPLVYWSYYTGTSVAAGTASTSAVISGDGTKVAFIEISGSNSAAILRILKWKAGQGGGTGYPSTVDQIILGGADWSTCVAGNSCMRSITFNGTPSDTRSAPFYSYGNDTMYVGDDAGNMHKFTGVFKATPAEVTTGGWPITVNAGAILTSPVYDGVSGNIFVGDSTGRLSFIREVGSNQGTCTPQPCLDPSNQQVGTGGAIVAAPIVDGTDGTVFAVNGTDTTNHGTILQANTALGGAVSFPIGGNAAGSAIYSGAFDNNYFTSGVPTLTGHMYVCGKDPGNADRPAVYQLSFNGVTGVLTGVGSTPLIGLANGDGEACSPVSEFNNPNGGGAGVTTDSIFFSIGNLAANANPIPTGSRCGANNQGCVISVNVTGSPAWPPATVTATAPTPPNNAGSTSGIVVDNTSTSPQASSFYFSLGSNSVGVGPGVPSCNQTAGRGCAVKLTQSALN
jgi:hypothetical protein